MLAAAVDRIEELFTRARHVVEICCEYPSNSWRFVFDDGTIQTYAEDCSARGTPERKLVDAVKRLNPAATRVLHIELPLTRSA